MKRRGAEHWISVFEGLNVVMGMMMITMMTTRYIGSMNMASRVQIHTFKATSTAVLFWFSQVIYFARIAAEELVFVARVASASLPISTRSVI